MTMKMTIRPMLITLLAAFTLALSPAARAAEKAAEPPSGQPKVNFIDTWMKDRLEKETLDTSATALLREAHALEVSRGDGNTSQTRAAGLYEQFLTRYSTTAVSLEVRRTLLNLLSALYSQSNDPAFRDKEFQVAREGLRQVDELAAQKTNSEYLEWLRGEYLSPLMSLGGEASKEEIGRVHAFYLKALEDKNLAPTARTMLFYRLIDMALHQRNYEEAMKYVRQGEALANELAEGKDAVSKSMGATGRYSFLFLAAKTAILQGDKKAEQDALDQLKAVTPDARLKGIERALDRIRKRAAGDKPEAQ